MSNIYSQNPGVQSGGMGISPMGDFSSSLSMPNLDISSLNGNIPDMSNVDLSQLETQSGMLEKGLALNGDNNNLGNNIYNAGRFGLGLAAYLENKKNNKSARRIAEAREARSARVDNENFRQNQNMLAQVTSGTQGQV